MAGKLEDDGFCFVSHFFGFFFFFNQSVTFHEMAGGLWTVGFLGSYYFAAVAKKGQKNGNYLTATTATITTTILLLTAYHSHCFNPLLLSCHHISLSRYRLYGQGKGASGVCVYGRLNSQGPVLCTYYLPIPPGWVAYQYLCMYYL